MNRPSKEEMDKRMPLPPETLVDALQDKVKFQNPQGRVVGRPARAIRSYSSRRPGTNPRTGEKLVPWEDVQVLDPETPAWDYFLADVPVLTDEGSRVQRFKVPMRPHVFKEMSTKELTDAADDVARSFGFTVVRT